MIKSLNKYLLVMIILACSSGGSSPTDSGDDNGNGDNTNPYELPNAVDYGYLTKLRLSRGILDNFHNIHQQKTM